MMTTNYPLAVQKMFATVPTLLTATIDCHHGRQSSPR